MTSGPSAMVMAMTISAADASGVPGRVMATVAAPKDRAISTASTTGLERPLFEIASTPSRVSEWRRTCAADARRYRQIRKSQAEKPQLCILDHCSRAAALAIEINAPARCQCFYGTGDCC